jgi:S1-C subfamily serine protease
MSTRAKRARVDNKHSEEPVRGPRVGDAVRTDAPEESAAADGTQRSATDGSDVERSPSVGGELPVGFDREPTWEETINKVSSAIVVRAGCQPSAAWVWSAWPLRTSSVSLPRPSAVFWPLWRALGPQPYPWLVQRDAGGMLSLQVLKITGTRAFDTEAPGSSHATGTHPPPRVRCHAFLGATVAQRGGGDGGAGFIVDKARGLILTNRHVVLPGPVVADAIFQNREEVPVHALYRDPVSAQPVWSTMPLCND